jgi:hypothetical protein
MTFGRRFPSVKISELGMSVQTQVTDLDLVLARSDFMEVDFQARLETLLQNEKKLPGDTCTCGETIPEISIELSRQRCLLKRYKKLGIDWQIIDEHLEGLSDLFSMGREIVFSIEFFKRKLPVILERPRVRKRKEKRYRGSKAAESRRYWSLEPTL